MTKRIRKQKVAIGSANMICDICKTSENDDMRLGQKYEYMKFKVHYFCLLLINNIYQCKNQNTGLMGFSRSAITNAYASIKNQICSYCKNTGASVTCSQDKCGIFYHLPCGLAANCVVQYYESFKAYCHIHSPQQKYTKEDRQYSLTNSRFESCCGICYEPLISEISYDVLWAPCCRNGYFHRNCVLQFAHTAGSVHFKCPLCNDTNLFVSEMKRIGIYVPLKDAAWELEPNAFYDLYLRYDKCDAEKCLCPHNRTHNGELDTDWMLMLCIYCGSSGVHKACYKKDNDELAMQPYKCDLCVNSCKQFKQSFTSKYSLPPLKCLNPTTSVSNNEENIYSESESSDSDEIPCKKLANNKILLIKQHQNVELKDNKGNQSDKNITQTHTINDAEDSSFISKTEDLQVIESANGIIPENNANDANSYDFNKDSNKIFTTHTKENQDEICARNIFSQNTEKSKTQLTQKYLAKEDDQTNILICASKLDNEKENVRCSNRNKNHKRLEEFAFDMNTIDIISSHPVDRLRSSAASDFMLNKRKINIYNNQVSQHAIRGNHRSSFKTPVWKQKMVEIRNNVVSNRQDAINNLPVDILCSNQETHLYQKDEQFFVSNILENTNESTINNSSVLIVQNNDKIQIDTQKKIKNVKFSVLSISNQESNSKVLQNNPVLADIPTLDQSNTVETCSSKTKLEQCAINKENNVSKSKSNKVLNIGTNNNEILSNSTVSSTHRIFQYSSPGELFEVKNDQDQKCLKAAEINMVKKPQEDKNIFCLFPNKKNAQGICDTVKPSEKINILSVQILRPGELACKDKICKKQSDEHSTKIIEKNIVNTNKMKSNKNQMKINDFPKEVNLKKLQKYKQTNSSAIKTQPGKHYDNNNKLQNVTNKEIENRAISNESLVNCKTKMNSNNITVVTNAIDLKYDEHFSQEAGPSTRRVPFKRTLLLPDDSEDNSKGNNPCEKIPAFKKLLKSRSSADIGFNRKCDMDDRMINATRDNFVILSPEILRNSKHDELLEKFRKAREMYNTNKAMYKNGERSKSEVLKYWAVLQKSIADFQDELLRLKNIELKNIAS